MAFGYYNTRIGRFKQGVVVFVCIPLSIVWSNQLSIHKDIQTLRFWVKYSHFDGLQKEKKDPKLKNLLACYWPVNCITIRCLQHLKNSACVLVPQWVQHWASWALVFGGTHQWKICQRICLWLQCCGRETLSFDMYSQHTSHGPVGLLKKTGWHILLKMFNDKQQVLDYLQSINIFFLLND